MFLRPPIKGPPCQRPHQTERPRHHKGRAPAPPQDAESHQRRRDHIANAGAHLKPAGGQRTFARREPFGHDLGPGGDRGGLVGAQQAAEKGQPDPAPRQRMKRIGHRPAHRKDHETQPCAQRIEHRTRHRLHHRIAGLKGDHDPAVMLGRDVQFGLQSSPDR
ncbi:hypothetical protein E4T56_gene7579 [Termitomyces sp. T112]|nr:hypothetical protein E4T56_gene7579 [Termitomyces sp. T112]